MSIRSRIARLETSGPKPTRVLPLRNDLQGKPDIVAVAGGSMFERKAFHSEEAFWAAIHADEARTWEADPHNPDPIKSLFDGIARDGRRLGDGR